MKQHKWHKEIKAWADGAEIEWRWEILIDGKPDVWRLYQKDNKLTFFEVGVEYRIKPQPKEPQYLYVFSDNKGEQILRTHTGQNSNETYIGKIKLEVDDD